MKFYIFLDKLPCLNKKEIDNGNYPFPMLELASLLRSFFLISNDMRHGNSMKIICTEQFKEPPHILIIDILGKNLRYLNPDERETLLLLQKITTIIYGKSKKKRYKKAITRFNRELRTESTPGINLIRSDEHEYLSELKTSSFIELITNQVAVLESGTQISNIAELVESLNSETVLVYNLNQNLKTGILTNTFDQRNYFYNPELNTKLSIWQIVTVILVYQDQKKEDSNEITA